MLFDKRATRPVWSARVSRISLVIIFSTAHSSTVLKDDDPIRAARCPRVPISIPFLLLFAVVLAHYLYLPFALTGLDP